MNRKSPNPYNYCLKWTENHQTLIITGSNEPNPYSTIESPYKNCGLVNGNSQNPYNYWLKCVPNQKSKGITVSNEHQSHKTLIFITRRALNWSKVTKPLFLLSEMNFEVNTKSPNPYNYCLKCIIFVTMFTESCFSLEIMHKSHVEMPCPRFGCTNKVLLGFVLELRTDRPQILVEKQYIRVTISTLCPFWRLTQWPTSGNISLKLALDTKWITPIDLSCRVVRVVAWALGLVSRWGSPLRSVFTPNLRYIVYI